MTGQIPPPAAHPDKPGLPRAGFCAQGGGVGHLGEAQSIQIPLITMGLSDDPAA
jgi:hypothetical protein